MRPTVAADTAIDAHPEELIDIPREVAFGKKPGPSPGNYLSALKSVLL